MSDHPKWPLLPPWLPCGERVKAKLEGPFADELALLQPTPGYMRLLKESVLQIWKARKAAVRSNNCSFPTELRSMERALFEPA